MFQSLSQFYNSDEWRKLRVQIMHDRTSADGFLYDEHNGKPLINSFDIVAHHKIPLTTENVNDFNISLNPENIMLVSHRSHNEIHSRFGFCTERKVYYVYGSPCSGKTTFVNNIKGNSDIILDIDNVWECITGTRYEKPNALKSNTFALRDCLFDMIRTRAGKWERAFVVESGARKSERMRRIQLLGAEPIFIDTDKMTCLKRLASDDKRTAEQKALWVTYIDDWFDIYEE